MSANTLGSKSTLTVGDQHYEIFRLDAVPGLERLPYSLKILAEALLRTLYARPIAEGTPVVTCDLPTAELVKVSANAFLATKISFINAIAGVCEAAGADVTVLADALGSVHPAQRRHLWRSELHHLHHRYSFV